MSAIEIIKANGRHAGIIRETATAPFVNLDSPGVPVPATTTEIPDHINDEEAVPVAEVHSIRKLFLLFCGHLFHFRSYPAGVVETAEALQTKGVGSPFQVASHL